MGNKRDKLYANLINSGKVTESEIGTREQFMAAMKDESSARRIHKNLINSGKFDENEIGNSDQFYNFISSDFSRPEQVSNPKPTQQTKPLGTPKEDKPKAKPAVTRNLNPSFASPSWGRGFNGNALNSQEAEAKRQEAVSKANEAKNTGYPVTKKWTGDVWKQNADKLKTVEAGKQAEKEELAAKVQEEKARQEEVDRILNGEEVPTTSTPAPEGYKPIELNVNTSFTEAYKTTPTAEDPFGFKAREEQMKQSMAKSAQEGLAEDAVREKFEDLEQTVKQGLDEAASEVMKEHDTFQYSDALNDYANVFEMNDTYKDYETAQSQITEARQILDAYDRFKAAGSKSDWNQFWKDAGISFSQHMGDTHNWTWGIQDADESARIVTLFNKYDDNPNSLSKSEQAVLDAVVINTAVQQYFGENGIGNIVGATAADMIPFVIEILANPATGIGKAVGAKTARAMAKYATRRFLMKGVGRLGTKTISTSARLGARALADIAAGYIMAGTTGLAKTTAGTFDRMRGDVQVDDMGNYIGRTDQKGFGEAFGTELTLQAKEYQSEMVGEYFGPLSRLMGRSVLYGTLKGVRKTGSEALRNWTIGAVDYIGNIQKKGAGKYLKDLAEAANYQGPINEYLEEVVGNIEQATLGIDGMDFSTEKGKGAFNAEDNWATFLSVCVPCVAQSAVSVSAYVGTDLYTRNGLKKAELGLQAITTTEEYEKAKAVLDALDYTKNGKELATEAIKAISGLDKNIQQAAYKYVNAKAMRTAFTVADQEKKTVEREEEEEKRDVAIEQGETAETPEERYSIGEEYENASSALENANGGAMIKDTIDRMTAGQMGEDEYNNVMNNLSPELRPLAEDYLNATHKLTGMRNAVDRKVGESVASQQQKLRTALNITEGDIPQTIYKAEINGKTTYLINYDENSDQVYYVDDNGNVVSEFKDKIPNLAVEAVDYPAFISQYETAERTRIEKEYNDQTMHNPKTYLNITPNNPINVTMNGENRRLIYTGQNDEAGNMLFKEANVNAKGELAGTGKVIPISLTDAIDMQDEYWRSVDASHNSEVVAEQQAEEQQPTEEEGGEEVPTETEQPTEAAPAADEAPQTAEEEAPAQPTEAEQPAPAPTFDYSTATPAEAADYIYNQSGRSEEASDRLVQNKQKAAQKAYDEVKDKHSESDDDATFDAEEAEYERQRTEAKSQLDYWNGVMAARYEAKNAPAVEETETQSTEQPTEESTPIIDNNQETEAPAAETPVEETQSTEEAQPTEEPVAEQPKKRRGRPKKVKEEVQAEPVAEQPTEQPIQEEQATVAETPAEAPTEAPAEVPTAEVAPEVQAAEDAAYKQARQTFSGQTEGNLKVRALFESDWLSENQDAPAEEQARHRGTLRAVQDLIERKRAREEKSKSQKVVDNSFNEGFGNEEIFFRDGENETETENNLGEAIANSEESSNFASGGKKTQVVNISQNAGDDSGLPNRISLFNEVERVAYKQALNVLRNLQSPKQARKLAEDFMNWLEAKKNNQMRKLVEHVLEGVEGVVCTKIDSGMGVYLNDNGAEVIEYTHAVELEIDESVEGAEANAIAAMGNIAQAAKQDSFIVNYPEEFISLSDTKYDDLSKKEKENYSPAIKVEFNNLTKADAAYLSGQFLDAGLGVTITGNSLTATDFGNPKYEGEWNKETFYKLVGKIINNYGNAQTTLFQNGERDGRNNEMASSVRQPIKEVYEGFNKSVYIAAKNVDTNGTESETGTERDYSEKIKEETGRSIQGEVVKELQDIISADEQSAADDIAQQPYLQQAQESLQSTAEGDILFRDGVTAEMDKEYMDAVESGDLDKAQRLVNDAAKAAMPNTKVVDENGNPKIVFHGSPVGNITVFDRRRSKIISSGLKEFGTFFTSNEKLAELYRDSRQLSQEAKEEIDVEILKLEEALGNSRNTQQYDMINAQIAILKLAKQGKVYACYLDLQNPKEFDAKGLDGYRGWRELREDVGYDVKSGTEAVEAISGNNSAYTPTEKHDGIIAHNIADYHAGGHEVDESLIGDAYLVFDANSNKIKSADAVTYDDDGNVIPLRERFNESNNDIRYREGTVETPTESTQTVTDKAKELGKELGVEVEVIEDVNTITHPDPKMQARMRKAKGWYDRKTGKVVIVAQNNTNTADVEKTILHEIVGHKGLRKVVGRKAFNTFLDKVFNRVPVAVRDQIMENARRKYNGNYRVATEEYLASFAERGFADRQGTWNKIKNMFLDIIRARKFEKGGELTDKDIQYILWRSYQVQSGQSANIFGRAADMVMRRALNIDESKIDPADIDVEEEGEYEDESDILFSMGSAATSTARDFYNNALEGWASKVKEAWVDMHTAVDELEKAIEAATGDKLQSYESPYTAALINSSKSAIEAANFMLHVMMPLQKAARALLKGTGMKKADLEKYLNAKHGLERNEAFARRDAQSQASKEFAAERKQADKIHNDILSAIDDRLRNGVISQKEANNEIAAENTNYQNMVDDIDARQQQREDELYAENRKRDYSGFTELFAMAGDVDVELTELEQRAADFVVDFESKVDAANLANLWKNIKAATDSSVDKSFSTGLISAEQRDLLKSRFQYYVPLRGFDAKTAEDIYDYVNYTGKTDNSVNKKAKGRTSAAGQILANIGSMGVSAINSGNSNMVMQQLYYLAINHPTDLLSISKVWYEYNAATDSYDQVQPDFTGCVTAEDFKNAADAFETRMQQARADGLAYTKADGLDLNYRVVNGRNAAQHGVKVKIGGNEYIVYVNGNPRAAQAINGALRNSDKGWFTKLLSKITRWRSKAVTSLNPNFMVSNLQRDVISALTVSMIKKGGRYTSALAANIAQNIPIASVFGSNRGVKGKALGIYALYSRYKNSTLDMTNDRERYFKEFLDNGGETGISQIWTVKEFDEIIKDSIDINGKNYVSALFDAIGKVVEAANRGIENSVRFAAYQTSREQGSSVQEAIYDAKEASVNFNRTGSGAMGNAFFKANYMFINPAIQGTYQYLELVTNKDVRGRKEGRNTRAHAIGAFGVWAAIGGMNAMLNMILASMLSGSGDDDDELGFDPNNTYANMNAFKRRNYINVFLGEQGDGNKFLQFALPQEVRVAYGIGVIAAEYAFGVNGNKIGKTEADNLLVDIFGQVAAILPIDIYDEAFTSVGGTNGETYIDNLVGEIARGAVPSHGQPVAEAYIWNEDFIGRRITGQNEFNKNQPEYKRVTKDAEEWLVEASRLMNDITGGDDYSKSKFDTKLLNPNAVEYLFRSYLGGLADVYSQSSKTVQSVWNEDYREPKNYPFVSRLLYMVDNQFGKSQQIDALYYYYLNEIERTGVRFKNVTDDSSLSLQEKWEYINEMMNTPEGKRWYYYTFSSRSRDAKKKFFNLPNGASLENENKELSKQVKMQTSDTPKQMKADANEEFNAVKEEAVRVFEGFENGTEDFATNPLKPLNQIVVEQGDTPMIEE